MAPSIAVFPIRRVQMRKTISNGQAALILATFLLLAACGGGASNESDATNAGGATAPPSGPAGAKTEAKTVTESDYWLGAPRDDIARFLGTYGDAANPDQGRGKFVVMEAKRPREAEQAPEIPPGYLMIAPIWADVANLSMKSLSDTTFEHVTLSDFAPPEPIVVEFELGPDGNAVALTFTSGMGEFGRRQRLGDIPADWR